MISTINTLLFPIENIIKKYRTELGYFFIFLAFLSFLHFWSDDGIKESGEQAIMLLWIILWIPICARVLGLRIFTQMMPLRKELGILMGTLAFVHAGAYIIPYSEELLTKGFWITDGFLSYLAFGFLALVCTIPLTLTSSTWAMKKMGKNWKRLHRAVYLIIIFTVAHVVLLKWFLHFEVFPVILLVLYFVGKVLEWKGVSLGKMPTTKTYPKGQKWLCVPCGFIYDPLFGDTDSGIKPGTEFIDIPDNWSCPLCGVKKSDFIPYDESSEIVVDTAIITEKKMMNPTTVELTIETEKSLESKPGQFMSFLWEDSEGRFPRSYSIARQEGRSFTFLIKVGKGGRGASLLEKAKVGDTMKVRNIAGRFIVQETTSPKIFIATGTGLAPIYRMFLSMSPAIKKSLYFSVATPGELFYVEELRAISNLHLHICTTREEYDEYHFGRIDVDAIIADPDSEWYLCGNPTMVKEAREKLTKRGFEKVYSEEF